MISVETLINDREHHPERKLSIINKHLSDFIMVITKKRRFFFNDLLKLIVIKILKPYIQTCRAANSF